MNFRAVVAFAIGLLPAALLRGQAYTFGTFEADPGTYPLSFVNHPGGIPKPFGEVKTAGPGVAIPITFRFTGPTGLDTTDRTGTLIIATHLGASTSTAVTIHGSQFDQPNIGGQIIVPYQESATESVEYLNAYYSGDIAGSIGSNTATFSGTLIVNRSSFLNFLTPPDTSFSFTLVTLTRFTVADDGLLNSFTADISGGFSGNAVAIPEPAFGCLWAVPALALRRRKSVPPVRK